MGEGALNGIRVIDATQMLAGPMAGTRLGDLGADVIKVEPPVGGEFNRTHGFGDAHANGEMTTFLAMNRNKRSLAVDLKSEQGQEIIHALVETSDIFIQNFRHGTAARIGVDYETLKSINPGLIYCSISGYGSSGPYRDRPGQDLVLQGYSGSMFSVGQKGDPPTPSALWAADVMTGYQAVIGILGALAARQRLGIGQLVEVDMLAVVLDCQLQELVTFLNAGLTPERTEERGAHGSIPAPYGSYETSDGWLNLAMCPLPSLGEVLDNDWLRSLTDYHDGHVHRDEIYRTIREAFRDRTTAEWIELCDTHGVWAGPVYDFPALVQDPHVIAENYIVQQPQLRGESARTIRPPLKMSTTQPEIRRGAPALGEHTEEILSDLGFDADKVHDLINKKVVATAQ